MIYVDTLLDFGWRLGPSCHMIADSEDELHAFALKIGLKRAWFQNNKAGFPHYDLVGSKRAAAVAAGAKELSKTDFRVKVLEIRVSTRS